MANEAEVLRSLYEASLESTVQGLRTLYRLKQQATDGLAAGRDPAPEPRVAAATVRPADVLLDLTRASLQHYNQMLGLSARYTDTLVECLRDLARQSPGAARGGGVRLALRGAAGTEAAAEFDVDNPSAEPVEVTLAVSEFHGGRSGTPFTAPVRFTAADDVTPGHERRVPPRTARRFRVTVGLGAPFESGQHYAAQVLVVHCGRVVDQIALALDVDGEAAGQTPRVNAGGRP